MDILQNIGEFINKEHKKEVCRDICFIDRSKEQQKYYDTNCKDICKDLHTKLKN